MTLDGLTLHAVADELNERLKNGKIQKILMPGREELALQVYSAAEGTLRLVLSADAGCCSAYLTKHSKPNPKTAPAFCMFLRKHIAGAVIRSVEQSGLDRVLTFVLETRDELFRSVRLRLIAEIMGKYSNIILTTDDGHILDSIRRVPADRSSKRQILPGGQYMPPPQRKWDPLHSSVVSLAEILRPQQETRIDRRLTSVLDGISTQSAEEILHRAGLTARSTAHLTASDYENLARVTKQFVEDAVAAPRPTIQSNTDSVPVFFSIVPFETFPEETRTAFENANEMLDEYYFRRSELSRVTQARDALLRSVRRELGKTERKIRIFEESVESAAKTDTMKKRADLITANLYRLKKGMRSFEAMDYETGENVEIQLDPSSTPAETAQKLYRKIAKLKRGAAMNEQKLSEARDEEEFLLGSQLYTEAAHNLPELDQIRTSLQEAGYLPSAKKHARADTDASAQPMHFRSPGGCDVFVGRNDRQNELLTNRTASKDDIWFHAQKTPGSHVILRTDGKSLDELADEDVVFAAELAASHSRAKKSGKTPVDYTQRRNLRKPPHARPGKVIYDTYYTVYVDASAQNHDKYLEPEGPPFGTM